MRNGSEAQRMIRTNICDRIDDVARELPHLSAERLAFAIDDIRRSARDGHLFAVADLARGLENAIAESSGSAMVLPFLEAMSDAADCDNADPAIAQVYLASVGLRLQG